MPKDEGRNRVAKKRFKIFGRPARQSAGRAAQHQHWYDQTGSKKFIRWTTAVGQQHLSASRRQDIQGFIMALRTAKIGERYCPVQRWKMWSPTPVTKKVSRQPKGYLRHVGKNTLRSPVSGVDKATNTSTRDRKNRKGGTSVHCGSIGINAALRSHDEALTYSLS